MRESVRWGGSFAFVLAVHAGAICLALGWTQAEVPYSPPPAAVMMELAPLAAPETTPNEAPPPELSEAVPESQELPPVDIKPMKVELPEPEEPPPVEMPPPVLAEVILPEPEPPPPVERKPPPKPRPVEKPKPPHEKKPTSAAAAPQAAPDQARRPPQEPRPIRRRTPCRPGRASFSCTWSATSAIPTRPSAAATKASSTCASP